MAPEIPKGAGSHLQSLSKRVYLTQLLAVRQAKFLAVCQAQYPGGPFFGEDLV